MTTRNIAVGPVTVTREGTGTITFLDKTGSEVKSGSNNAALVKLLDAVEFGSGTPTTTTRTDA